MRARRTAALAARTETAGPLESAGSEDLALTAQVSSFARVSDVAVERTLGFGADGALAGIWTEPVAAPPGQRLPAFLFVSAGMVHRVGPGRLHVTAARALASRGFSSFRFDFSGIGDSPHRADGLPADESAVLETQQAMDALASLCGTETFVLVGLCSGAITSFRTALLDQRVEGAVLLNPQGFHHDRDWNAHVLARVDAQRYASRARNDRDAWRRALTGGIDYRRVVRVLSRRVFRAHTSPERLSPIAAGLERDFHSLDERGVRLLVVCSAGDSSVGYLSSILGARFAEQPSASRVVHVFDHTDHSLTLAATQQRLLESLLTWAEHWRSSSR